MIDRELDEARAWRIWRENHRVVSPAMRNIQRREGSCCWEMVKTGLIWGLIPAGLFILYLAIGTILRSP